MPGSGDFTTLVIGGDNSILLDISGANPLLQNQHPGGSISLSALFDLNGESLLGFAGAPDVGNFDRNDQAVIFSGEFDDFFPGLTPGERLQHLVVTIAHELGHNLGLRHVADTATADIMKQTAPRLADATFGNTLFTLAEEWSDGVRDQNDHVYLSSVLGKGNASGLAVTVAQTDTSFSTTGQQGTLFDVTITITAGDGDSAATTLHFATLDGTQNIPLANLPAGAKISLTAASTPGGPLDIFSGTPLAGDLTLNASFVPLFGLEGELLPIPLAKGAPGTLAANGSLSLATNDLGDVTILPGKVKVFTDADGDIYTVRLTGPGLIGFVLDDPDGDGRGGLTKLRVDDTLAGESILSITVKKSVTGDGFVHVGEISGSLDSGLKSLTAPAVNLTAGGVVFSGALGNVVVRDLLNGADLIATGIAGVKTNLTAHLIGDGSDLAFAGDVGTLKVARIGQAGINVTTLAKLIVAGDRLAGIPGDIAGQINVAGFLGSVTARDLLPGARIDAGGSALERTTLVLHEVMNGASISLASLVTSLKAARIGDAQISAQQFDVVAITGDARNFIPGDFGADLFAINKIGKFTARDLLGTASIEAGGLAFDKTTFTAHAIMDGVSIVLESSVSTFKTAFIGNATIEVAAMASLQVLGDANAFLFGDFLGSLTLTGGDAFFVNALAAATIKGALTNASFMAETIGVLTALGNVTNTSITAGAIGTLNARGASMNATITADTIGALNARGIVLNSTIVADTIGTLNAGGIVGSDILAGFRPTDANAPRDGGAFEAGGALKSLIVGAWGFADSFVAAPAITSISIASLIPFNGGEEFGILVDFAPLTVAIKGFTYVKNGASDQFLEDFHLKVL
jgi:hypothetical protein